MLLTTTILRRKTSDTWHDIQSQLIVYNVQLINWQHCKWAGTETNINRNKRFYYCDCSAAVAMRPRPVGRGTRRGTSPHRTAAVWRMYVRTVRTVWAHLFMFVRGPHQQFVSPELHSHKFSHRCSRASLATRTHGGQWTRTGRTPRIPRCGPRSSVPLFFTCFRGLPPVRLR